MELPASPSAEQLEQLLSYVVAGQNIQETNAYFKRYLKTATCVQDLMARIVSSPQPATRQLACVLLRKKVVFHWKALEPAFQSEFRTAILRQIEAETIPLVRKAVANLAAKLASATLKDWPEVLQFISTCSANQSLAAREIGLYMLAEILDFEDVYEVLSPHIPQLGELFVRSLSDNSSLDIRKNALKAMSNLFKNAPEGLTSVNIASVIPLTLQATLECAQKGEEETVIFAFDALDELVSTEMDLAAVFPQMIDVAMKVGGTPALQVSTRDSAINFVESALEYQSKVVAKNPELVRFLLEQAFTIAAERDDDPEAISPVDMGLRLLDTMALELPNKVVYATMVQMYRSLRTHQNYLVRKVAVLTPGVIAEGCSDFMKQELKEVLQDVLSAFQDTAPQVREAAGLSLAYMSDHLRPEILDYHAQVIPSLMAMLGEAHANTKQKAIYALDLFCEGFEDNIGTYLEGMLNGLVGLVLRDADLKTKQMALSALNSALSAAEKGVEPYFDTLIQVLAQIINPQTDTAAPVRAAALQCIGQLFASCSMEKCGKFIAECSAVASSYLDTTVLELREAAFAYFYLLSRNLQGNFDPYVEKIVAEAIKSCESAEGMEMEGEAESSDEDEDNDKGLNLKVRTVFLDEKTAAIHALGQVALACPGRLGQYLPKLLEVMETLWDYFHSIVREQTVTTYQQIVEALNKGTDGGFSQAGLELWQTKVLPKFIESLTDDEARGVVCRVLEAVEELTREAGAGALGTDPAPLFTALEVLLNETAACQKMVDEDEDHDHDEMLMGDVADVLTEATKRCKEALAPQLQRVLPSILKFTRPNRSARDRTLMIGCLAELFGIVPALGAASSSVVLPICLQELAQNDAETVRNTVFLLGVICECAGSGLVGDFPAILQALNQQFSRSDLQPATVDNLVAAVARMVLGALEAVPLATVLPVWFAHLPLKDDYMEVKTVLRCILHMASKGVDLSAASDLVIRLCLDGLLQHARDHEKYSLDSNLVASLAAYLRSFSSSPALATIAAALPEADQQVLRGLLG